MRHALSLIAIGLVLTGCGSTEPNATPYVSAVVAGSPWRGSGPDAELVYTVDAPDGAGMWTAIASRPLGSTSELLSLSLPNPPAPGTYAVDGATAHATFATCPTQTIADCAFWTAVPGDPGQLEIIAVDTAARMIEGTFSFQGHFLGDSAGPVTVVSNGRFRIRLATSPTW